MARSIPATTDPKSDDEVNVLRAGGNYGWPHVAGLRDDMAYQYARWYAASVPCALAAVQ